MKLTPEQKKLDREYNRLLKVIEGAERGKGFIRPLATGYTDAQHAMYAKYNKIIESAFAKIADLKVEANV